VEVPVHIRSLLAGAGLAVVVAAVPLVIISTASADPTPSTSSAGCPRQDMRQAIDAFVTAHPEVAAERTTIRALPPDQRADAWRKYLADHPDLATAARDLRSQLRGDRWEVAGNVAAALAAHPELDGLRDALADAKPGDRRAAAQAYLAQHPEARATLQQLRQACRPGG
jgi:hemophore-related protein